MPINIFPVGPTADQAAATMVAAIARQSTQPAKQLMAAYAEIDGYLTRGFIAQGVPVPIITAANVPAVIDAAAAKGKCLTTDQLTQIGTLTQTYINAVAAIAGQAPPIPVPAPIMPTTAPVAPSTSPTVNTSAPSTP